MNNEVNVPITTPRIIANAKLRILSPPNTKIHNNTINVLNEVLIVRAKVVFNESLNNCKRLRFGYKPTFGHNPPPEDTVEDNHLIIDRITDSSQDSTNECLVDFQ